MIEHVNNDLQEIISLEALAVPVVIHSYMYNTEYHEFLNLTRILSPYHAH